MNFRTLVSVVIPCYNQGAFLGETIQSVYKQTFQEWECIIVNDGSIDASEDVALGWVKCDPRIKYFKTENNGVSFARNFGISKAIGEYIVPLDSDDIIHPEYIRLAIDEFTKDTDLSLVYSSAELIGDVSKIWKLPVYSYRSLLISNMIFCAAVMKKDRIIECGMFDISFSSTLEDWEFYLRYLNEDSKVLKLEKTLFYYRIHNGSHLQKLSFQSHIETQIRHRIFRMYPDKYYEYYGDFISLELENRSLRHENNVLKNSEYKLLKYRNTSVLWLIKFFYRTLRNLLRIKVKSVQ